MESKITQKRSWGYIVKVIAVAILSGASFLLVIYLMSVFAMGISALLENGLGVWVPAAVAVALIGVFSLYYLRKRILKKKI